MEVKKLGVKAKSEYEEACKNCDDKIEEKKVNLIYNQKRSDQKKAPDLVQAVLFLPKLCLPFFDYNPKKLIIGKTDERGFKKKRDAEAYAFLISVKQLHIHGCYDDYVVPCVGAIKEKQQKKKAFEEAK